MKKINFKLNAKFAAQMKLKNIIGHHSIYSAMKLTDGPLGISAARAIANGMIL